MTQSMNDEAVYRTAPATPGLLNIGKSGEASWWRVCYQRGLPRLVLLLYMFKMQVVTSNKNAKEFKLGVSCKQFHNYLLRVDMFGNPTLKDKTWPTQ